MPEYQEILDSEVEPEAPLTSSLGVRFRDNPIALANGASGAPRIQTDALNNSAVTTAKINDGAVTTAKINNGAVTQSKLASNATGRAELKTGTNSVSGTLAASGVESISLTDYALFPSMHEGLEPGGPIRVEFSPDGGSGASSPKFSIRNADANESVDYSVAWRFVQS